MMLTIFGVSAADQLLERMIELSLYPTGWVSRTPWQILPFTRDSQSGQTPKARWAMP